MERSIKTPVKDIVEPGPDESTETLEDRMNELSQQVAEDDQTLNEISKRVAASEKSLAEFDERRPDYKDDDEHEEASPDGKSPEKNS